MTNTNQTFKFNHSRKNMSDALGLDESYMQSILSDNADRFNNIFHNSNSASEVIEAIHKFLNDDSVPNIDKTIMIYITFDTINRSNFSQLNTKEFIQQVIGES
jgi:hypothetical protein